MAAGALPPRKRGQGSARGNDQGEATEGAAEEEATEPATKEEAREAATKEEATEAAAEEGEGGREMLLTPRVPRIDFERKLVDHKCGPSRLWVRARVRSILAVVAGVCAVWACNRIRQHLQQIEEHVPDAVRTATYIVGTVPQGTCMAGVNARQAWRCSLQQ